MTVAGIIAEYNPFHKGHEYHLEKTKAMGADAVIAVMSGNYTQRCEPALFRKEIRAKAAVAGGVDVVLELPLRFSIGSAERFAFGGVSLLDSLGTVDFIIFGSECGDIETLKETARKIDSLTHEDYSAAMKSGQSFARVRASLVEGTPSLPNDILGVEYIRALNKTGSEIKPMTVKRTDGYHESATELRLKILQNDFSSLPFYSSEILRNELEEGKLFRSNDRLSLILLSFLRNADKSDFDNIYGINPNEGLSSRFLSAADSVTLDELYSTVKTKRFAASAVKRALLSAFLRIKPETVPPPYARILAFSDKGRSVIKQFRKNIPTVHNLCELRDIYPDFADEERRATDIYSLLLDRPDRGYHEYTRKETTYFE